MVGFLDRLGSILEELVAANEIDGEELAVGIQMKDLEKVLKGPEHFEEVFTSTIVKLMRDKNHKYDENCKENGKNPEALPELVLSKDGEKVSLCFEGNDGRSRIAITNRLSKEKSGVQEFFQETFLSKAFNTLLSSRKEKAGTKVGISAGKLRDICDILAEGVEKPMVIYFNNYLSNRAEIFKQHYKEILQSMKDKPPIKSGESVIADIGEGSSYVIEPTTTRQHRIRKSEIMKGTRREKVIEKFQSVKNGDQIFAFSEERSGNNYKSYVIHTPDRGGGALMIIEPEIGKVSTKLVYFTNEDLKNEPEDPNLKERFWSDKTSKYAEMSRSDFLKSDRCTTINHTDENTYLEKQ